MEIEIIYLLIAGLMGGILAGLLGIGGGVIYILILESSLKKAGVCDDQLVLYVIANSVFAIFIASISGNIKSIWKRNMYYKEVLLIGLVSSICSILGVKFIVHTSWYSKEKFNVIVVFLLVFMLLKMVFKKHNQLIEEKFHFQKHGFIGVVAGFISSLSGLGGGVVVVPLLQNVFKMNIKKAKNISLGVIGVMAFFLSIFNMLVSPTCISSKFQMGVIVIPLAIIMSVGVAIGSPLGVKLSEKISERKLNWIFGLLIVSVIIRKTLELIS